jgi:DNA-binding MarR family transcriptional regulator
MRPKTSAAPGVDGLRLVSTLILLVRSLEQQLRQAPGADTLAISDLGMLGQIDRGVDCPSHLARTLRLDPARVTHLTDRLVTLGYVTRASDPADRRRWRLSLTPSGAARLADGRVQTLAAVDALLAGLTEEERSALTQGVTGIRRVLDQGSDGSAERIAS